MLSMALSLAVRPSIQSVLMSFIPGCDSAYPHRQLHWNPDKRKFASALSKAVTESACVAAVGNKECS